MWGECGYEPKQSKRRHVIGDILDAESIEVMDDVRIATLRGKSLDRPVSFLAPDCSTEGEPAISRGTVNRNLRC